MSVINQMLRDLERRRVKQTLSSNSSGRYIDALNIVEKRRFHYGWLFVLIILCVFISASWYFLNTPPAQQSSMIRELNSLSIVQDIPPVLNLTHTAENSPQNKTDLIDHKEKVDPVETAMVQKMIHRVQTDKKSTAEFKTLEKDNFLQTMQQGGGSVENNSYKQPSIQTKTIIKSDKQTLKLDKKIAQNFRKNNRAVEKNIVKTYIKKSVETPAKNSVETSHKRNVETPQNRNVETPQNRNVETPAKISAETLFKKQRSKKSSTELVHQARLLMNQDQNAAMQLLEDNLIKITPDADYYALLANLYQRKKRFAEALGFYQKALEITPYKGELWMGIALAYRSKGDMDNSVLAFKKASIAKDISPGLRQYAEQQISRAGATD